ncbi:hypothetical protein SK128_005553, partial [Halocaridina rubra]
YEFTETESLAYVVAWLKPVVTQVLPETAQWMLQSLNCSFLWFINGHPVNDFQAGISRVG